MAEQIISKQCSRCKEIKPVSEFNKDGRNKNGLRGYCKSCQMSYLRDYRKTSEGKAKHKEQTNRSNARYPNHYKAKAAVYNSIKVGKLPRPDTKLCHYCPKPAQQYHHWHGYEKEHWLDVVPVCKECHQKCKRKIA